MPSPNEEFARQAYDAINRRDVEWLIERSHPAIQMHMQGVADVPVLYTGVSGVRDYFRDMGEIWESFKVTPEEIRALGDRVLVIARGRLRGRASAIDVDNRTGSVFTLRDGLVTEIRTYRTLDDARAAAGLGG